MNANLLTQAKQVGLLVVDEGHRLKNSAGSLTLTALNGLQCDARLLITGTPIQNNLTEFYTVANFVCPGLLGDLESFRRGKRNSGRLDVFCFRK
jgi:DNA repair and recombination protein RAD54 and RAD54-like protein